MTTSSSFSNYFPFERLDAYQLAVSVNRRIARLSWPSGRSHLRDQALRAADSAVLNLAEGWERGRHTRVGKNHFRIAKGSAGEAFACIDLVGLDDAIAADLQRLGAMLAKLAR